MGNPSNFYLNDFIFAYWKPYVAYLCDVERLFKNTIVSLIPSHETKKVLTQFYHKQYF